MAAEFLFGRCQLRLEDIEIDPDYCRERIDGAIDHLRPVFEDPNEFEPHTESHQFPILTDLDGLRQLLEDSRVSHDAFRESQSAPPYPRLTSLHGKFRCIHGRQRYEAAVGSTKLGPDTWWTVRLFCLPEGIDPRLLLREEVEHDHYQTKYNDGHVFCAVTYWEEQDDPGRVSHWMSKLSPAKQKRLKTLMRCKPLKRRLEKLRVFPGLLDALELGNGDRVGHSLSQPQISRNLDHIYDVWDRITLGLPRVRRAADVPTVRRLQMLAPSASSVDRSTIQEMMRSGELFSSLKDQGLRAEIEQRILQLDVLIPSVKSLHENTKYLYIADYVIKTHLVPSLRNGESLSKALNSLWSEPDECFVEYAEGKFWKAARRPSRELSYMTMVTAALRNFPRLCDGDYMGPRCEAGESHTRATEDPAVVHRFRVLAQKVGYSVSAAPLVPSVSPPPGREHSIIEPAEASVERRWNRPFSDSARFCASRLFLPQLAEHQPMAAYPRTLFVQRDFVRSFFGEIPDLGTAAWPLTQSPEPRAQLAPHQPGSDTSSGSQSGTPQTQSTLGLDSNSDMTDQPRHVSPGADNDSELHVQDPRRHGWYRPQFSWPVGFGASSPTQRRSESLPSSSDTRPSSARSASLSSANSRPHPARASSRASSLSRSAGPSIRSVGGLSLGSRVWSAARSPRSVSRSSANSGTSNAARLARVSRTSNSLTLRSMGLSSTNSRLTSMHSGLLYSPRSISASSANSIFSNVNSKLSNLAI